MRLPSIWRIPLVIMISACFVISLFPVQPSYAFSNQIIQRGATGDDVIELQARLQYNGYYHGPIDGVFGWSTYWSVRNFQKEFRLKEVDGLVGGKTKEMLTRATKYYQDFVYQQLKQGRRFTHYGGMPLGKQSAPSQQMIEQAKKAAEKKRTVQLAQRSKDVEKQGQTKPPVTQQGQPAKQPPAEQQAVPPAQQSPAEQQAVPPAQQSPAEQQAVPPAQSPPVKQQTAPPAQQSPAGQKTEPKAQQNPEPDAEQKKQESPGESAVNMPNGFSQNDLRLMANAVYGEARGESYIGQVAVAAVILNRINSPTFPNTASGVIYQPQAFTAVADGQINLTPNEQAKKAVLDAINGFDPTESAIYYFNPDTATNAWIWGRPQIKKIGKHIFCK